MNETSFGKQTIITDETSLLDFIDNINTKKSKKEITIICAGHFMLMPDKSKRELIPGIFENTKDEYYKNAQSAIGIFPQYTWKLGCIILQRIKKLGQSGKLSLLVNDWQLVPADKHREESKPNRFRDTFFKNFTKLPDIYNQEFGLHNLDFKEDLYMTDGEFFLREVRLRDRFSRRMKNIVLPNVSINVGICSLNLDGCGDISLSRENDTPYALTINSKVGCAGGITQMITDITNRLKNQYGKINFINLMPEGCARHVNVASELSINILEEESSPVTINITNLYFQSHGAVDEDSFYEPYGRGVICYEYKTEKHV